MKLYGVTGWKNSGKTVLMERLVAEFTRRGVSVSHRAPASQAAPPRARRPRTVRRAKRITTLSRVTAQETPTSRPPMAMKRSRCGPTLIISTGASISASSERT